MINSLYEFGSLIIDRFSKVVDILSSVGILGYSALDLVFGFGLAVYFGYVAAQWVIPE